MLTIQGLHMRAALLHSIRSFFVNEGFLEVDTPIRQPIFIPEQHISPIPASGQYLLSSPEISMKRLLGRGCTKIFQICPCFRRDERGRRHLEEFTMLEWYRLDCDYRVLMDDCRNLLCYIHSDLVEIAKQRGLAPTSLFPDVDVLQPWQEISVADAFSRYCPLGADEALKKNCFEEMLVEHVEPHLGRGAPQFLIDYPIELGSLAKKSDKNPLVAERFELYARGIELANGFSELTDVAEQRQRFDSEIKAITSVTGEAPVMPERFLADLGAISRAAGIALGIDRLFMVMMNYDDIRDAVSFAPGDYT